MLLLNRIHACNKTDDRDNEVHVVELSSCSLGVHKLQRHQRGL